MRLILSILALLLVIFSVYVDASGVEVNKSDILGNTISIGIIPSGSSSPFHQELIAGVSKAASEIGWNAIILTPDNEENITAQKQAMLSLVDQYVRMISLNTLDPPALVSEVGNATSAGIPVFLHNTLTPAEKMNISAYIGYNQFNGAAEMGYYAVRKLTEKHNEAPETVQGKIFILRGLPGFHANQRTAGFIAGLTQSPGIRIIGEETAGWDRETARKIAREVLTKDPGIEVFYGNSDEMAIGAALAVQDMGKEVNRDVFCLGIDGNIPTLEMIRNGTMTATLGVYPDRIGRTIVEQMGHYQKGGDVGSFFETPVTVVDHENVDSYMNGSSWTRAIKSGPEFLNRTW